MFLVHERSGLKPHRAFVTYLKQMKSFMAEVEPEKIVDLILRAIEVSEHPFGIDFLRRLKDEENSNVLEE